MTSVERVKAGTSFSSYLRDLARRAALAETRCIERELQRHDVVVRDLPSGERVIFRVPTWRERPLRRLRIEWYRLRRARTLYGAGS
jgi:hypothetical protein